MGRNTAPDAHEQFLRVGKAYEVLANAQSRTQYDYYLDNPADEMRNAFRKASWHYQSQSGMSVGAVTWSCFLGGLVTYMLLKPLYKKAEYFMWRKRNGVPRAFDRNKRADFLEKVEKCTVE